MKKLLSWSEFKTLSESAKDYSVSIYLPTHVAGAEIQQDPILLKNLLGEAKEKLLTMGMPKRDVETTLQEASALLEHDRFWRYQNQGLALFLTQEDTHIYRLPRQFEPMVKIDQRFYLKPLLPFFFDDRYFFILALSQNQVRFFQSTRYQISEIEVEDMPTSLAEALRYDDPEKQLQFHNVSGSGSQPMYHGNGSSSDGSKDDIQRFLNHVSHGLHPYLADEDAPLVLASVDYLQPIFKTVCKYAHILDQGVTGNPDIIPPDELREAAWPLVAQLIEQSHAEALEQYQTVQGTGQASDRPAQIVSAAHRGQIDTLFLAADAYLCGRIDDASGQVEIHDQPEPEDQDLIDVAAVSTALQGGKVYFLDHESMPNKASAAAIFRYAIPATV
jgi:hypothetical protein